ncbi:hypothetical protein [Tranquillimonas rosea]|uniref:hypothetical protein n=1 Tax=Tranquillimonas rosea TaxID=641238 RepID=UPI003BA95335
MTLFYYEAKDFAGRWRPRTSEDRPTRRGIRGVTEVDPHLRHLSLDQLHEVLSVDGKFRNTGPKEEA